MLISSNESMDSYDIDSLELPETREELKRIVEEEVFYLSFEDKVVRVVEL